MEAPTPPAVLVIDDEPPVARLLAFALRNEGCDVRIARDAREADRELTQFRPDLVVCDVRLPGVSGVEFVNAFKARPAFKDVPVLLMSIYDRPRSVRADGFIPKPFDIQTFLNSVRPYLKHGAA